MLESDDVLEPVQVYVPWIEPAEKLEPVQEIYLDALTDYSNVRQSNRTTKWLSRYGNPDKSIVSDDLRKLLCTNNLLDDSSTINSAKRWRNHR